MTFKGSFQPKLFYDSVCAVAGLWERKTSYCPCQVCCWEKVQPFLCLHAETPAVASVPRAVWWALWSLLYGITRTAAASSEEVFHFQLPTLFLRFQDVLHPCPGLMAFSCSVFPSSVGGRVQKKVSAGFLLQWVDVSLYSGFLIFNVCLKCSVLIDQKSSSSDISRSGLFQTLWRRYLVFYPSWAKMYSTQVFSSTSTIEGKTDTWKGFWFPTVASFVLVMLLF